VSKKLLVEPEDYQGWELLPEDVDVRCGRCKIGWVCGERLPGRLGVSVDTSDQCERRAVWLHRSTCGCGKCDMSRYYCSECLVVELMDECVRRSRTIEKVVSLVREYDKELTTREMVVLKAYGIEQYPPDPSDEYWKNCHQGKVY
jgi:hypothetical protein